MPIEKQCLRCGSIFKIRPSLSKQKYCSFICYWKARTISDEFSMIMDRYRRYYYRHREKILKKQSEKGKLKTQEKKTKKLELLLQKILERRELQPKELFSYLAGLFDGEGYVGIVKYHYSSKKGERKFSFRPTICISNKNKEVLEFVQTVFDFPTYVVRKRKEGYEPIYQLVVESFEYVLRFLINVFPYLIIKRKQAELVIEWITKRLTRFNITEEDEQYHMKLKELNKRTKVLKPYVEESNASHSKASLQSPY